MQEGPVITVCMPVYEPKREHLTSAIETLLAQTEPRWTLIIRDDCSQTDVADIVQPFLADPRIRFARNTARKGIGGNWNACLACIETPYIQFLFQDDLWEEEYLERAMAPLERNAEIGFASTTHTYFFEGDVPDADLYEQVQEVRRDILPPGTHNGSSFLLRWLRMGLHPNIIGEPTFVLLRTEILRKVGLFAEDMPQNLDSNYWARCLLHGDFAVIREDGGVFRVHPDGASARNRREGKGLFDRFRTMEQIVDLLPAQNRKEGKRILTEQLAAMIRKYKQRQKDGDVVTTHGDGSEAVKAFAKKHPIIALKALWRSR